MIEEKEKKLTAASYIIYTNIFLILLKLLVSFLTGSLALLSVFADSFFDFIGSILAYFGIRKASQPADESHLYGHAKFENIASLAQTFLISIVAVLIVIEAIKRIFNPIPLTETFFGILAMIINIFVDFLLSSYLIKKSVETRSQALAASAVNYRMDLFQNSAVLAGLFFASFGFYLADPLLAIFVALLMFRASFKIGKESVSALSDGSPSKKILDKIEKTIVSFKGVKSFHKLRARYFGRDIHVDVHIQLDPMLSLKKAHSISHSLKKEILKKVPEVGEVNIHFEPK